MNGRIGMLFVLGCVTGCSATQSPGSRTEQQSQTPTSTTTMSVPVVRAAQDDAGPSAQDGSQSVQSVTALWLGSARLYALTESGVVWRWAVSSGYENLTAGPPERVPAFTNAKKVAGDCAILADASVRCLRIEGQQTNPAYAFPVPGLEHVKDIAGGNETTCAALSDGTVRCWGNVTFDILNPTPRQAPVEVTGLSDVVELSLVEESVCARKGNGALVCWGQNLWGQLGDGSTTPRGNPVAVTGITNAVQVAAGSATTCARLADNTAKCWGAGFGTRPVTLGSPTLTTMLVAGGTGSNENTAGTTWSFGNVAIAGIGADHGLYFTTAFQSELGDPEAPGELGLVPEFHNVRAAGLYAVAEIDAYLGTLCAANDNEVSCWNLAPEIQTKITLRLTPAPAGTAAPVTQPTAQCVAHSRSAFHLREYPTRDSRGLTVTDIRSPLIVLQRGSVRRGSTVIYQVRLTTGNTGWMFLAPTDFDPACSADLRHSLVPERPVTPTARPRGGR